MLYIDDVLTQEELCELQSEMKEIRQAYHAVRSYSLVWACRRCGNLFAGDAIVLDALMLVSRCRRCKDYVWYGRMDRTHSSA